MEQTTLPRLGRDRDCTLPVRAVQFGEGNFLRAFIDWMLQQMNKQGKFNGMVRIVQPLPTGTGEALNAQGGRYTLILRGLENGRPVEKREIIDCVKDCLNPYTSWNDVVDCFRGRDLRFVFSNTTEAGIEYKAEPYKPGQCQQTFPAKLTSLLYERYQSFGGVRDRALVIIPCELIDKNGTTLRDCILHYAKDWGLPPAFATWLKEANVFVNTLVDRIVAGYPHEEAARLEAELGYRDALMVCGEPFHFLVIEGPQTLARELPLAACGLQVVITDDQTPYRTRKVRFLNGAHTSSVLAASLSGLTLVDEMMNDADFGPFVRDVIFSEVFHTVDLPDEEKRFFAQSVIERFQNPYARHRLLSIALNSVSKWKVRVLPSLQDYLKLRGALPPRLVFSLAALLRFYEVESMKADAEGLGRVDGREYPIADSPEVLAFFAEETKKLRAGADDASYVQAALARQDFWDCDLNRVAGLSAAVTAALTAIHRDGCRAALRSIKP
ncbi:MAG: tagaturonate reductase [Lentisphaeria bacterium]